jgi:hypothetical protein
METTIVKRMNEFNKLHHIERIEILNGETTDYHILLKGKFGSEEYDMVKIADDIYIASAKKFDILFSPSNKDKIHIYSYAFYTYLPLHYDNNDSQIVYINQNYPDEIVITDEDGKTETIMEENEEDEKECETEDESEDDFEHTLDSLSLSKFTDSPVNSSEEPSIKDMLKSEYFEDDFDIDEKNF